MKKKRTKKQTVMIIVGAFFLTCCLFGSSYALNNMTALNNEYNYFGTMNLELSYVDRGMGNGDVLSLVKGVPKTDQVAMKEDGYRFSITNVSNSEMKYRVRIVSDTAIISEDGCITKQMFPSYIRYQFDNREPKDLMMVEENGYVLYESEDTILPGNSEIHELRIWLKENTPKEIIDHYHGKIVLEEIEENQYGTYQKGSVISIGEGKNYVVLENSDSNNAYLKLLPMFTLDKEGNVCPQENTCLFSSKEDLPKLFERYQFRLEEELKTKVDLNIANVRLLEENEYQQYRIEMPSLLLAEQNPYWYYSTTFGTSKAINQINGSSVRIVLFLHKGLIEEEKE